MSTTRLLAVLGDPIDHSLTPELYDFLSGRCGIRTLTARIRTDESGLSAVLKSLQRRGFTGVNCTTPLKAEAFRLCGDLTPHARLLSCANTILFRRDPDVLSGTTTDGDGTADALERAGCSLFGSNLVLIGAGGTARAFAEAACRRGAASLTVFNRTYAHAEAMLRYLAPYYPACKLQAFPLSALHTAEGAAVLSHSTALFHATTLGMDAPHGEAFPSYDFLDALPGSAVTADAVYRPPLTPLLAAARRRNLRTVSGAQILAGVGTRAFSLLTGVTVSEEDAGDAAAYLQSLSDRRI